MQCPNCKLENMADALRCDCGYDFNSQEVKTSYISMQTESPSLPLLILGWICSALGGWIGIVIALHIIFAKDKQIKTINRFNLKSRKQAYFMLGLGVISFIFTIFYRIHNL